MRAGLRKSTAVCAASLLAISGQAQALSCLPADAVRTFAELDAVPEAYFVLHGTLTFDDGDLPPFVQDGPTAEPAPVAAQSNGKSLTAEGFTADYAGPVVLQITCAGPWCGTAQSGQEAVMFIHAGDMPVTVTAGPCGGRLFYDVTPATIAMLTSCMQGGTCSAE